MTDYVRDKRSPKPSSQNVSKVMSANKAKDTKPELLLRQALRGAGFSGYRLHWKNVPGRPDICYPGRKLAIFVHGCFWHGCPRCELPMPKSNVAFWEDKFRKNRERDTKKLAALRQAGWTALTFWECQLKDDIERCVADIATNLHQKSPISYTRTA